MSATQKRVSEDDLCRAFAESVSQSAEFRAWLLSRTKFRAHRFAARSLKESQIAARPNVRPERWWRHWFWKIPELGKEHETDIFLGFEVEGVTRFVIHIEVKLSHSLSIEQAASYAPRANHVLRHERRLPHNDFVTLLIAPAKTVERLSEDVQRFDTAIGLQEIAVFLPEFERAVNEMKERPRSEKPTELGEAH